MKIIYDERKTLQDKEKEDERVKEEKRKYTKFEIIAYIVVFVLFTGAGFVFNYLELWEFEDAYSYVLFGFIDVMVALVLLVATYMKLDSTFSIIPWYNASYYYYLKLKKFSNGTLLNKDYEKDSLSLCFKDADGFIYREKVYLSEMIKKEKAEIDDVVINFDADEIWIPYKEKEIIKNEDN